jgi:hypothetical protein
MIKYKMNLVKSLREAEKRHKAHGLNMVFMLLACLGVLGVSGYYVYGQIAKMQAVIDNEKEAIKRITAEYRKYQEMQASVGKADIELLNSLLARRIYWTRKLEAMATHLPDAQPTSYWITKFGYREQNKTFAVSGYGYITDRQEQLLALDEYLNRLRADPNYADVFKRTSLRSAVRSDESVTNSAGQIIANNERVSFEYASVRGGR